MSMIGHNQQQRSVQGLTDEDRKTLKKAVIEMNDSMTRVGAERELNIYMLRSIVLTRLRTVFFLIA
jgi:hypothetical protein